MANSLDHRRYKGVYKSGHKFKAQLQHCGNQYYLGSYSSALQAAHAYDEKWREIYATDPSIVKTLPNFDKVGLLYAVIFVPIDIFCVLFVLTYALYRRMVMSTCPHYWPISTGLI